MSLWLAMLTVYGDESHDETRERVFAVAGLLGSKNDWDAVEDRWLGRTGGAPFHAAECESRDAQSDGDQHRQNLKLYADLAKILAASNLMGFGAVIHLPGWRAAIPGFVDSPDQPYYKCFSEVVIYFARIGALSIPPERVKFIFDRSLEREFTAHRLYTYMAQSKDWPHGEWLADEVGSATRAMPGIQMVDLFARECMKELDNQIGPVKRPRRRSMQALADTKRFRVEFYMPEYSQAYAESAMKQQPELGLTAHAYFKWLDTEGLVDTLANRIRFLSETGQ